MDAKKGLIYSCGAWPGWAWYSLKIWFSFKTSCQVELVETGVLNRLRQALADSTFSNSTHRQIPQYVRNF